MLRTFIVLALRNMARSRVISAVIVIGLAIALSAAILIALFISDKLHAEAFVPNAQRIYLIGTAIQMKDHPAVSMPFSAPEVAGLLLEEVPQVAAATRRYPEPDARVRQGSIEGYETIDWVDPNFFSILRMPALRGDPHAALSSPDAIVVTRQFAEKYFGTDEVLGRTLELGRDRTLRIAAVLKDPPRGTSLTGQIYASSSVPSSALARLEFERGQGAPDIALTTTNHTYVLLKDPGLLPAVSDAIAGSKRLRARFPEVMTVTLLPVALSDLHLRMPGAADTSIVILISMGIVALLVLFVAGANFVTLMTARAGNRAREVGVRKVVGADRRDLLIQFMVEAVTYVALALVVAFFLVALSAEYWEALLASSFSQWFRPGFLLATLACALLFSILAGLYPAAVLSRFPPQRVLRGELIRSGGSRRLREALVAAQFAILTAALIAAAVIAQQVQHSTRNVLRFDGERTVTFASTCSRSFVDAVKLLRGVAAHFCSAAAPMGELSFDAVSAVTEDGAALSLSGLAVDYNFFDFYAVRPLAGRVLSPEHRTDEVRTTPLESAHTGDQDASAAPTSVVINQSAMYRLGFSMPHAALGRVIKQVLPGGRHGQIVGVVPDFVITPTRSRISPLLFVVDPGAFSYMSVHLSGGDSAATLKAIEQLWKREQPERAFRPVFLSQYFDAKNRDIVIESTVFQAMSLLALAIATSGLLGLASFDVQSRAKEIGVRKVIGASRFDIAWILFARLAQPIVLSNLIAWPVAYFALRYWLEGFVHRIDLRPGDFLTGSAVAFAIAGGVVALHAWHAGKMNPADLLRHE